MWSFCRSALLPSSVTVCPFTLTRPCVINSSALRREVTPAAAMIFCNLSGGILSRLCSQRQSGQLLVRLLCCVQDQTRLLARSHSAGLLIYLLPSAPRLHRRRRRRACRSRPPLQQALRHQKVRPGVPPQPAFRILPGRSEEHTSELQS